MDVSKITITLTEQDAETLHRLLMNEGDYHSQDGDLDGYLSAIESFLEQTAHLFQPGQPEPKRNQLLEEDTAS